MSNGSPILRSARVVEMTEDGTQLKNERDAVDLIAAASERRAELVVIPVRSLPDDFFRLKTQLAGTIVQKFVTYRLRLVIMGDVSNYLRDSSSFRDFVYECNNGSHVWFVTDLAELNDRLQSRRPH